LCPSGPNPRDLSREERYSRLKPDQLTKKHVQNQSKHISDSCATITSAGATAASAGASAPLHAPVFGYYVYRSQKGENKIRDSSAALDKRHIPHPSLSGGQKAKAAVGGLMKGAIGFEAISAIFKGNN